MNIFDALAAGAKAQQQAKDTQGRSYGALFGTATNLEDPLGIRRIKATTEGKGSLTEMDFSLRVLPCPYWDPPLPAPGMSLALSCFDGDPHDGSINGVVMNRANPPFAKADPIKDDWRMIPGKATLEIRGDRSTSIDQNDYLRVDESRTVSIGKALRLQNDAGAYLELTEDGHIVLCDAWDNCITLGGTSVEWDLNGHTLNFVAPGDVKIANKSVIVVGSTDTDGDTNNTRGY